MLPLVSRKQKEMRVKLIIFGLKFYKNENPKKYENFIK